jgi:hypothetical protein
MNVKNETLIVLGEDRGDVLDGAGARGHRRLQRVGWGRQGWNV